eukprot:GHVU01089929.1.p1 GENE.GHVU01089929.1~~GHVU01089929.1.p1  ORF type:complete len:159 (+),score=30.17 GHVU01089929.1:116-592(+)
MMVGARVFCFFLITGAIYQLNQTHSLSDMRTFGKRQFLDAMSWGHQMLTAEPDNLGPKYTPLAELEKDDDIAAHSGAPSTSAGGNAAEDSADTEYHPCLKSCSYWSYAQLQDECLMECECMKELVVKPCMAACPEAMQKSLRQAKEDACFSEENKKEL